MKYYEMTIVKTCKPYASRQEFQTYDRDTMRFKTIEEVKAYLKNTYGNCKKQKIYRDRESGAEHVGYIYCFVERWLTPNYWEQHWIDIEEVDRRIIIVK